MRSTSAPVMLPPRRRYFCLLALILLATPLVWGIVLPDSPELVHKEGRRLAAAPAAPELGGVGRASGPIDAYLKDHFGLRHAMINCTRT